MSYPVTLATRLDAGLCAVRGQWRLDGGEVVATYNTAQELEMCLALSDVWSGKDDGRAVKLMALPPKQREMAL